MKLLRKNTAPVYKDNKGQEYPNLFATVIGNNNDMFMKQLQVYWAIFVNKQAYLDRREPLFSGQYVWTEEARTVSYDYVDNSGVSKTVQLNFDAYDDIWDDLRFINIMEILNNTVGTFVFKLPDFENKPWSENWEVDLT